ncbi:hypothetical protein OH77DRAFT_1257388 [Trametes cingulata]|nr:hypothetical protein OH77DRAFT_1257388 [Trametes cingulata]
MVVVQGRGALPLALPFAPFILANEHQEDAPVPNFYPSPANSPAIFDIQYLPCAGAARPRPDTAPHTLMDAHLPSRPDTVTASDRPRAPEAHADEPLRSTEPVPAPGCPCPLPPARCPPAAVPRPPARVRLSPGTRTRASHLDARTAPAPFSRASDAASRRDTCEYLPRLCPQRRPPRPVRPLPTRFLLSCSHCS